MIAVEPDLLQQAAHAIAAEEEARGHDVEVRVDAWVSLNGRPAERLIDPTVDLAAEPVDLGADDWILPPSPPGPAGTAGSAGSAGSAGAGVRS